MAEQWKSGDICYWCDRLNGLIALGWGMIDGIYGGYAHVFLPCAEGTPQSERNPHGSV